MDQENRPGPPEGEFESDVDDLPPQEEAQTEGPPAHPVGHGEPAEGAEPAQGKKKRKKGKKGKKDGLGSNRGIETMFRTSYRTHVDLSSLADNKANIMIGINGIIVSVLIASIAPAIDKNPWLTIPTAILLLGCLVSMVFAVLAARPRVNHHRYTLEDVDADRANILFFGNFVHLTPDEYVTGMKTLMGDTDRLYANMIRDLHSLGGVLQRKFTLLRTSYTTFMWTLALGVVSFIVVLFMVAVINPRGVEGLFT
jgi:hypothetical protein